MKQRFVLSPPLVEIEQRLFGISPGLIEAVKEGRVTGLIANSVKILPDWAAHNAPEQTSLGVNSQRAAPTMPGHLAETIRRRVSTTEVRHAQVPAAGQIVRVMEIVTPKRDQLDWVMLVPLYVLLDAHAECAPIWHGWLVTGESDYAGWWDLVLQDEDEPFDPEAAMVQLWNPVRLYLPMAGDVVAQLKPQRIQAVRSLAADFLSSEPPADIAAWPGKIAARMTSDGMSVATGSPLGDERDPRHSYQALYFEAAEAIRVPARLALELIEDLPAGTMGQFLWGLIEAAGRIGQRLAPEPRVAIAMKAIYQPDSRYPSSDSSESIEAEYRSEFTRSPTASYSLDKTHAEKRETPADVPDLLWDGIARIRVVELTKDGDGRIAIFAEGPDQVSAEIRRGEIVEDRVTVQPGGVSEELAWNAGTTVMLSIEAIDGRRLDLPLSASNWSLSA